MTASHGMVTDSPHGETEQTRNYAPLYVLYHAVAETWLSRVLTPKA